MRHHSKVIEHLRANAGALRMKATHNLDVVGELKREVEHKIFEASQWRQRADTLETAALTLEIMDDAGQT